MKSQWISQHYLQPCPLALSRNLVSWSPFLKAQRISKELNIKRKINLTIRTEIQTMRCRINHLLHTDSVRLYSTSLKCKSHRYTTAKILKAKARGIPDVLGKIQPWTFFRQTDLFVTGMWVQKHQQISGYKRSQVLIHARSSTSLVRWVRTWTIQMQGLSFTVA